MAVSGGARQSQQSWRKFAKTVSYGSARFIYDTGFRGAKFLLQKGAYVARMTGLKHQQKSHATKVLLIGETGSGKTSFLNLISNCQFIQKHGFAKGSMRFHEFNDNGLENVSSRKLESKTSGAKLYNVELCELNLGVIDTPGFGDTRGLEEDKEHTKKIVEILKEEEYIHCVCLVINGRQCRMGATLRYVLTEIASILPRKILDNVIVVFTNTANPLDLNFDPNSLQEYFGRFIENPYCKFEKVKQMQGQLSAELIEQSLEKSFNETTAVLMDMCTIIKSFKLVHTDHFIALYQKKQEIEKKIMELLAAYDYQRNLEKKIEKAAEEVDAALRTESLNANWQSTKTKPVRWVPIETGRHNTLCGAKDCYSNCHEPCNLDKSFDKEVFRRCWCISPGKDCSQCGHHYTLHYHSEVRWEKEGRAVEPVINEETKTKFYEAQSMVKKASILKQQFEDDKKNSEQERERLNECLLETVQTFQTLGISRNYVKLLENQLAMIEHRLVGTTGPETSDLQKTKTILEKELKVVQAAIPESDVDVCVKCEGPCNLLHGETGITRNGLSQETASDYYRQVRHAIPVLLLLALLLLLPLLPYNYYYSGHVVERQLIE